MKLLHSQFTIAEIRDMLQRKDLVVNKAYQRSPDIWPHDAKSYFIDTILEGYPFPKVYFYEVYDPTNKKPRREVVDGQQRITTVMEFLNNELRLTSASKRFKGLTFDELEDEDQKRVVMTPVQVDLILSAERAELLEMFRRINAYTAPLNEAEKRHALYQGKFKWFINEFADAYSPLMVEFNILTSKQALRMADAEFLAELALVLEKGIVDKNTRSINAIYKTYDDAFPKQEEYENKMKEFFEELRTNLGELRSTFMMKSYVVHSLFCAMMHRKYGIPNGIEMLEGPTEGVFYTNRTQTLKNLEKLAHAHEVQDLKGEFAEYVTACLSTTHRVAQRKIRSATILRQLV